MNIRVAMEQSAVSDLHRTYIRQVIFPNIHSGLTLSRALVHVTESSRPRSDTASEPTNIVMAWCCGDFRSFQMTTATTRRLPVTPTTKIIQYIAARTRSDTVVLSARTQWLSYFPSTIRR